MPRRRSVAAPLGGSVPTPPPAMTAKPADDYRPPPTSAERQAELERLLGLRPGELDPRICDARAKEDRLRMGRYIDAYMGVKQT